MHEAGLLAAAVAEAFARGTDGAMVPGTAGNGMGAAETGMGAAGTAMGSRGPHAAGTRRPVAIEIRVHDPMHVAPESARLHAELALRARGLADVAVIVSSDPVTCVLCAAENEVQAEHPFCSDCGWPLPDRGGHAVEAILRWADPGAVA